MTKFKIIFQTPWLLLLFIPAIALILRYYFRTNKKYRLTRNRIISFTLQIIVMALSVSVLAGVAFTYEKPNLTNEILLLVDASYSNRMSQNAKDEFIKTILDESDNKFQMGIITFGKNQVYEAQLSNNTDKVYDKYRTSPRPDDSATDIASALMFAARQFSRQDNGKIVLITDGIETDGDALSAVMSIASSGIKVDTVFFPDQSESDILIVGVKVPDYNIIVGDVVNIGVIVQNLYADEKLASLVLYDNGEQKNSILLSAKNGVDTYYIEHKFETPGPHELRLELQGNGDTIKQNNTYYSYLYLDVFDRILIIERNDEASRLKNLLENTYDYKNINRINIKNAPQTVNELRAYDQIILMNIANSDMPKGFDLLLYDYVYKYGGGMLTVGGSKLDQNSEEVANAYNRTDMQGTLYQQMLPVNCIDYTPPLGLAIIIDCSGSMSSPLSSMDGESVLDQAKVGARAAIDIMSDRDYCAIISLDHEDKTTIDFTPIPQKQAIHNAIDDLEANGGTVYAGAIERAGSSLSALTGVEKRHILFISDGMPGDDEDVYGPIIENYYNRAGITLTYILVNAQDDGGRTVGQNMATMGHGRFIEVEDPTHIPRLMREDLTLPEIREFEHKLFKPRIVNVTNEMSGIKESEIPELGGFYGTRAKKDSTVVLRGEYVPLYVKWNLGKGKVGSFMCDLDGPWSETFLTEINYGQETNTRVGLKFINNVILGLFPTESIRPREIDVEIKMDNYGRQANVIASLREEEIIELKIIDPPDETGESQQRTIPTEMSGDFSRCTFFVYLPGVYEIIVQKKDKNGNIINEYITQTVFSYSSEYNIFFDREKSLALLTDISLQGEGALVDNAKAIFDGARTTTPIKIDPRVLFMIIAITLFLLDIAIRKFKFKWPWEIVRDRRAKKLLEQEPK